MIAFKQGDKIVCIDNKHQEDRLTLNKIYTVAKLEKEFVYLEDVVSFYYPGRFELVKE